jgi:hypothetical protein
MTATIDVITAAVFVLAGVGLAFVVRGVATGLRWTVWGMRRSRRG